MGAGATEAVVGVGGGLAFGVLLLGYLPAHLKNRLLKSGGCRINVYLILFFVVLILEL